MTATLGGVAASPQASSETPLVPGTVVGGRYRVVSEIGGGGMGYVFQVEHTALERRFALKVLRVGHWDSELISRFEREAKALGRVSSPRVAQVSDFGIQDGVGPYYVMELVSGESLESRLERGPIPPEEAVQLAIALAEALQDVHEQGIVHRDLKPGNIGLPKGPIPVKLLDFGLAASIDDAFLTRITKSHQVLGSLPYISPEQFTGARPTVSQDIWALGIVFYEMLTGRLPFSAPSTAALMHKILTAPPVVQELGEPLGSVVGTLLAKDPKARPATAADAAALLRGLSGEEMPSAISVPAVLTARLLDVEAPTGVMDTGPTPETLPSHASGIRETSQEFPLRSRRTPWVVAALLVAAAALVATLIATGGPSDEGLTTPSAESERAEAASTETASAETERAEAANTEETNSETAASDDAVPSEAPASNEVDEPPADEVLPAESAPEAETPAPPRRPRPRIRTPRTPTMRAQRDAEEETPAVDDEEPRPLRPSSMDEPRSERWSGELIE